MVFDKIPLTLDLAPIEIIDGDRGNNYPSLKELSKQGFCLFLNAGNVTVRGFEFQSLAFIDRAKDELLRKGKLRRGDSVLTTRGTVGNVAFFSESVPFEHIRINSGMVIIRPVGDELEPAYLNLFLRSASFQDQVKALTTGSAQPQLPIRDLNRVKIRVPDIQTQRQIVSVIAPFDERIEILQRTNGTLEKVVKSTFQSWFVDFDPVRAKAEGREPGGMDAATAALFPYAFNLDVPSGWSRVPLDSIATFLNGLALQKFPATPGDEWIPAIKIAQLRKGSSEGADRVSTNLPAKYRIVDGDLLFSWSGSLEVERWSGGEGALNQHLFKVTSEICPMWFVYFWLREHLPHFREVAESKVTTMGHIQRHHLREALVALPPAETLSSLSEYVSPIFERMFAGRLQMRTLVELRDTLLPRLTSGKLRVPEAEKMLEAVL